MRVRRRDFIKTVLVLAVTWPLAALAQTPKKPLIGLLGSTSADAYASRVTSIRLRQLTPNAKTIAMLVQLDADESVLEQRGVQAAARATGPQLIVFDYRQIGRRSSRQTALPDLLRR